MEIIVFIFGEEKFLNPNEKAMLLCSGYKKQNNIRNL